MKFILWSRLLSRLQSSCFSSSFIAGDPHKSLICARQWRFRATYREGLFMTDHWGWVATLAVGLLFVGVTVAVLAALDGHVKAVFVSIGCLLALLLFGVLLLVAYGVIVIVLRNAFGIELPNPLN